MNQKLLDKKKTKELEWDEEYRKLLKEYQVNAEDWDCFPDLGVNFINDLLTQQRTELLEEILNLECLKEEEFDESDDVIDEEVREKRNQLRKEIIDEINKL